MRMSVERNAGTSLNVLSFLRKQGKSSGGEKGFMADLRRKPQ